MRMDFLHRKTLLVVAVAALAVLAGCTGGNGPGTATPANNSTDNGGSLEPVEELNASYLNDNTEAAVQDGGSYTSETTFYQYLNSSRGESESWTNSTQRVEFDASQGARETTLTVLGDQSRISTQDVYTENDTTYQRLNSSLGVSYEVQSGANGTVQPVNTSSFSQNYTILTDSFAYEADGTATVDDTTTVRYSSTNLTDDRYFVSGENATISNASSTLYVDADGVVREATISYTIGSDGATSTTEVTFSLSDIGSTSVDEPGWVDEARNSTS